MLQTNEKITKQKTNFLRSTTRARWLKTHKNLKMEPGKEVMFPYEEIPVEVIVSKVFLLKEEIHLKEMSLHEGMALARVKVVVKVRQLEKARIVVRGWLKKVMPPRRQKTTRRKKRKGKRCWWEKMS